MASAASAPGRTRKPCVSAGEIAAGGVGVGVQLDAGPGGTPAHPLADGWGVLADPGREHDRVEAAEGGRQRTELAARPPSLFRSP
jgi:hypothetical protein